MSEFWKISEPNWIYCRLPVTLVQQITMYLPFETAKKLGEVPAYDVTLRCAALKHVLLNEAFENQSLFTRAENVDDVCDLVVQALQNLAKFEPSGPKVQNAFLPNMIKEEIFVVSKRSIVNRTRELLPSVFIAQFEMIAHQYKCSTEVSYTLVLYVMRFHSAI